VTSPRIKVFFFFFFKFNVLGNYSVFSKFEFGKFLPFMAIPNFEFNNCN
jgi:hypothetical protein